MKSKKMIIAVLLFAAVAVSGATFAYWASGINGDNTTADATVAIGEGETVETTVAVGDSTASGTLVPSGYEDSNANPATVDNEDNEFTVEWTMDNAGLDTAEGTLNVSITGYTLDGVAPTTATIDDMFTITFVGGTHDGETLKAGDDALTEAITAGTDITYTVNVEFSNEPANVDVYDEIINSDLAITFAFSVDNVSGE